MDKKILLLGSTGAFGTAVERVCERRQINYVSLSHNDFEITNKNDLEKVIEKNNPNVIINSVALVGINPYEDEPQRTFDVNSIAVSNLAKICQKKNIILVQPSSNAIFDGKIKRGFYTENSEPNPASIYSVSKYAAEFFAKNLCEKHYIPRLPMLFGPRRNNSTGFADKVMTWIKEGKEIKAANDKIDSFGYTLDLANLLMNVIEEEKPYGIYQFANSGKASFYEFASEIIKILGVNTIIHRAKDADFKSSGPKILSTPAKSIKLKPLRTWQEALRDYIANEIVNK